MSDWSDALERAKALGDYDTVTRLKAELAGDVPPVEDDTPKTKRTAKVERATKAKPESR